MTQSSWFNNKNDHDSDESLILSISSSHIILWVTAIFLGVALLWANLARLDEVTRGTGRVIPSSQTQIIQNLEGGILSELLVKEGDSVEIDQPLIRIDNTHFLSSFRDNKLQSAALQARIARLSAEAKGEEFNPDLAVNREIFEPLRNELNLHQTRRNELLSGLGILNQQKKQREQELIETLSEQNKLSTSYELAQKEYDITQPLVAEGAMSEVELLRLEREVNELKGKLNNNRLAIPRIKSAISEAENRIKERQEQFISKAQSELNNAKTEFASLSESSTALEDRVKRTEILSPVKGTVKQIKINTIGGVIQPGMDLIEIVPSEDVLLIEADIRPADIAFLRPGQRAMVKITAYDFAIYGGLPAKLEHISADTITDEQGERFYQVRLITEKTNLGDEEKPLPIIPGMATEVDILTGNKTVMDYLLKPIKRAQAKALRER